MESFGIPETIVRATHPTSDAFRPENVCLEIIHECRQVYDFDEVGQSKARQNANRFYQEIGFGTSVVVQFIVALKDVETNEFWNYNIVNNQRRLILNNGSYSIEVDINPNGLVCFPPTDHRQDQLPNNMGNVKCVLPVESGNEPIDYRIQINLYHNDRTNGAKTLLHYINKHVCTHLRGRDVYDCQEGRHITLVDRPVLKIAMTGIFAEKIGIQIKMHFQNLGDNGFYQQFYAEQQKLLVHLDFLKRTQGKDYKDLELFVVLEEGIMLFGQNEMPECEDKCMEVMDYIMANNTPNSAFLGAKAYYIISAIYRQKGDFTKAEEYMAKSTELLEPTVVCEETAVNQYNWAAYLAEKAAKEPLSLPEKEEAEFRFQNTLSHWENQTGNNTVRCAIRSQNRNINYLLRTSRQKFPDISKPVSEDSLAKAAQAIEHVKQKLLPSCSKRHKVTFHIGESDYYIRKALMVGSLYPPEVRKANAEVALSILNCTLRVAEKLALLNEMKGIHDRVQNIEHMQRTNCFDGQGECLPHYSNAIGSGAIVQVSHSFSSRPVEHEWNTMDNLMEELTNAKD